MSVAEPPGVAAWSLRTLAAATIFLLFLAVQVGVPVRAAWGPRPASFAWHMYSSFGEQVEQYSVRFADGSSTEIDPFDYIGQHRPDVPVSAGLPAHLCREMAGAVAVHVRDGRKITEHGCR